MSRILIKNILHNDQQVDILIENDRFAAIENEICCVADVVINGAGKAILPPFYNGHNHAAMTLLRGAADDMQLFKWLNEYIWPMEAELTAEDIYHGSRLAILEMIRSGTVFFNDMYWFHKETLRAVEDMGVKAALGITFIDQLPEEIIEHLFLAADRWLDKNKDHKRIQITIAPHAVYTVGKELFTRCIEFAKTRNIILHTHLSETSKEVQDCVNETGMTPVRYLESMGGLFDKTVLAHVIHIDEEEAELLAKRNCIIVHNPCSNMKLGSGIFNTPLANQKGYRFILGTDGCSSNNNLDMREEMKFAAMLAKVGHNSPEVLPAEEVFYRSTQLAAEAFGLNAGIIEVGKQADAILINLNDERMVPNFNLISNWVYAANTEIIDTVICDGRILMQNRIVPEQEEIIAAAMKCIRKLEKHISKHFVEKHS